MSAPVQAGAGGLLAGQHRVNTLVLQPARSVLRKDRDALLAFYDLPAEHWVHLRTTNPIESAFATIRHRGDPAKGRVSGATMLLFMFKLAVAAEASFRRLKGSRTIDMPAISNLQDRKHGINRVAPLRGRQQLERVLGNCLAPDARGAGLRFPDWPSAYEV